MAKELLEVVDFGLDLVKLGVDVAADKKVDMADLAMVLGRVPLLVGEGAAAFQGIGEVPVELKDLSEEDAAALIAHVTAKLALEEGKAKAVTEKALKAAFAVGDLVRTIAA